MTPKFEYLNKTGGYTPEFLSRNNMQYQNFKISRKKRMSLITGKQVYYTHTTPRSKQYRRLQLYFYNFLERPAGFKAMCYQFIM
jgi:hypothetical protein